MSVYNQNRGGIIQIIIGIIFTILIVQLISLQIFSSKYKLAADNKKRLDKIAAANAEKLKKAAAVLDIQKIQIAAALRGKISEEEKIRLQLMQAIEDGNADKAEKLAQKLNKTYRKKTYTPNVLSFPLSKNEGEIFIIELSPGSILASMRNCVPNFFVCLEIKANTPPCF